MGEHFEVVLVEHVTHGVVRTQSTSPDIDAYVFNWDAAEAHVVALRWSVVEEYCRQVASVRLAGAGGSLKSRGRWVIETASYLMLAGGRSELGPFPAPERERRAHGLLVELAGESISYVSQSAGLDVVAVDWVEFRRCVVSGNEKSVRRMVASISNAILALDKQPGMLTGLLESVESFARGEWDGALATLGLDWAAASAAIVGG